MLPLVYLARVARKDLSARGSQRLFRDRVQQRWSFEKEASTFYLPVVGLHRRRPIDQTGRITSNPPGFLTDRLVTAQSFPLQKSFTPLFDNNFISHRNLHISACLFDLEQKSKVELTVEALKKDKEEKSAKAVSALKPSAKDTVWATGDIKEILPAVVPKKTLWQKVVHEAKHYYHGFRLLAVETRISWGLLRKLLAGDNLTRREHKQLVRTVSDIFRLVPFVVILVIPFAEFALPFLLKFFPNMLPSTFEEKSKKEETIRKNLKVKLEMAKFLQETIHETALEHKELEKSTKAEEFANFFDRIRISGDQASNEDIMKFAKLFEDDLTLDNLPRDVIVAMCRLLEIGTYGLPQEILRFQLRMRLRNLKSDDRMIQMEGIDNLTVEELQSAVRARGMKALGVSDERLKSQLKQWLELSLNEKIPPTLLVLTRAMYFPDTLSTEEQIKSTIAKMPEKLGDEVEVKLAEQEGAKPDYAVKLRLVKEEQETIKKEQAERKEREEADKESKAVAPPATPAPDVLAEVLLATADAKNKKPELVTKKDLLSVKPIVQEITKQDMEHIEDIIEKISKDKSFLLEQQDLKEEALDYKEDIDELKQLPEAAALIESKAAKRLSKRVDKMLKSMEKMMTELEAQKKDIGQEIKDTKSHVKELQKSDDTDSRRILEIVDEMDQKKDNVLNIQHLLTTMKQLSKIPDEDRLARVEQVLKMMDVDKDGNIDLEHALKVIELLGEENYKMSPKQLEEVMDVLRKETILEESGESGNGEQKKQPAATSAVPSSKPGNPTSRSATPVNSGQKKS